MANPETNAFNLPAAEVVRKLNSDTERGLSSEQARRLLEQVGPNELPEEAPTPLWKRFLEQFKDFLIIILLAAAAISVLVAILHPEGGGEESSVPAAGWRSTSTRRPSSASCCSTPSSG
jgi:magnesium-transporting ATPase (P-type)